MRLFSKSLFLLFFSFQLSAQTPLTGTINQYAKVVFIDPCEGQLTIEGPNPFLLGDEVLIIQMKGAVINESDSDNFGNIEGIGAAGLFEANEIDSVSGTEVFLKYTLLNNYDIGGLVQLVSFPKYENAIITDTVKAINWNGDLGGIIAFQVENTLDLQAPVNADGAGFRGGQTSTLTNNCTFLTNANDYFYAIDNWRGAPKGEGISAVITGKEQGRGAQANGGGGGNDHNAGGGGGSNITFGGSGGRTTVGGFGCDGDFPGVGGKSLPDEDNRIYLGGGGGAGHDNNGVGTEGANGGGIIIISAINVLANGQKISANGHSAEASAGDGAGGGGAGGTIILDIDNIAGNLIIDAKGGNGGDQDNPSDRCIGTGGGGSGGRLLTTVGNNFLADLSGGMPGANLNTSNQCPNDPINGATVGQEGEQSLFSDIPTSDQEQANTSIISQPEGPVLCVGENTTLEFIVDGTNLDYQWQQNIGGSWEDIQSGQGYLGESTFSLEVINVNASQNGILIRCLVVGPCINQLSSDEVLLTVDALPQADFDFVDLGNNELQFDNLSNNASSFFWDFGDGTTSDEFSPVHMYQDPGQYEVILTAMNDCGELSFSQIISIGGAPSANFSVSFDNACVPVTVQFSDQSTGNDIDAYFWEFAGGTPSVSTEQNPVVEYTVPGLYDVRLTVSNMFGENTLQKNGFIEILPQPIAEFDFTINMDTVFFTNNSTGANNWFWEFGDGQTSSEMNPIHNYDQNGAYQVTLTVSNLSCGSAFSDQVVVDFLNTVHEDHSFVTYSIYPNPASDFFNIEFDSNSTPDVTISIFDVNGRMLERIKAVNNDLRIELEDYSAGIYFIKLASESGTAFHRLIKTETN
ncbi:MAG: PKD domain-containing protein [Bacteroidota bacterium]